MTGQYTVSVTSDNTTKPETTVVTVAVRIVAQACCRLSFSMSIPSACPLCLLVSLSVGPVGSNAVMQAFSMNE